MKRMEENLSQKFEEQYKTSQSTLREQMSKDKDEWMRRIDEIKNAVQEESRDALDKIKIQIETESKVSLEKAIEEEKKKSEEALTKAIHAERYTMHLRFLFNTIQDNDPKKQLKVS